jgi:hypothetical protein
MRNKAVTIGVQNMRVATSTMTVKEPGRAFWLQDAVVPAFLFRGEKCETWALLGTSKIAGNGVEEF